MQQSLSLKVHECDFLSFKDLFQFRVIYLGIQRNSLGLAKSCQNLSGHEIGYRLDISTLFKWEIVHDVFLWSISISGVVTLYWFANISKVILGHCSISIYGNSLPFFEMILRFSCSTFACRATLKKTRHTQQEMKTVDFSRKLPTFLSRWRNFRGISGLILKLATLTITQVGFKFAYWIIARQLVLKLVLTH